MSIDFNIIYENGIEFKQTKCYYDINRMRIKYIIYKHDDQFHRDNNPAIIWYDRDGNEMEKSYYKNGKRHREDGPAFIYYGRNRKIMHKEYFIDGIRVEDEFKIMIIDGLHDNLLK